MAILYPSHRIEASAQPSLIGNYETKEDLNPGVYTKAYKDRLVELASQIIIKLGMQDQKSQDSFASLGEGTEAV